MNKATVLKFTCIEKAKYNTGEIHITNLEIVGEGEKMDITWDEMELYLDGKLYQGGISTWAISNVSSEFLLNSILNSYLRDNKGEYTNFEGFEVFKPIEDLKEYNENGLLIKLPVYEYGGVEIYELSLATPNSRYYHHDDSFRLVDNDGSILTDMECFYMSALTDDIVGILKGKVTCLYKDKYTDEWIEDLGGKEGFLKEYDEETEESSSLQK